MTHANLEHLKGAAVGSRARARGAAAVGRRTIAAAPAPSAAGCGAHSGKVRTLIARGAKQVKGTKLWRLKARTTCGCVVVHHMVLGRRSRCATGEGGCR